jgi:hypothetical protein
MQKFNPQVPELRVAGMKPQLAGGSIKGDGNLRVLPAWDPQRQGGAPQMQPAQLGDMNTPRGAQPIQLAQPGRAVHAQPSPALAGPEEPRQFQIQAQGRDGRLYTAPVTVGFPPQTRILGYLPPSAPQYQMGGQEETHVFTIRGITPDNREVMRTVDVIFPAGVGTPILSAME